MKRQIDTKVCPTKKPPNPRSESPGSVMVPKASGLNTETDPELGPSQHSAHNPIRATLVGPSHCEALGITARGHAPVLDLCRALVAAGHDPRRPLHAYRGDVLALIIHSLGAAAQLRVATHAVGFERIAGCTGGPPVRQNEPSIVRGGSDGERACAATAKRQRLRGTRGRRR